MSGIFGILNLDGQPAACAHLEAMRDSMVSRWAQGSFVCLEEGVGIGQVSLPHADEPVPRRHSASGVVLAVRARLDNRADLISELGWESGDSDSTVRQMVVSNPQSQSPDGDLVLYAYLRWGQECVQHLIGDWALAAWDPRRRKLFLARDHGGISSLYYYRGLRLFAFASSIKGLLALPDVPQHPNLESLARQLTVWTGTGEGERSQTAYEGICRLLPAHTLTVTAEQAETRRYWRMENTPPLRLSSDDDYVQAFLEVYAEAVRCRLRGALPGGGAGVTLSSGLDSGSVCALAARELRARGERLTAFTHVPLYDTAGTTPPGRYGDESSLVELDRRYMANLDVHLVRAENVSPLAGIRRALDVHARPLHAASNQFWLHALIESAQQRGLSVLLTGQLGNATISWGDGAASLQRPMGGGSGPTQAGAGGFSGLSLWQVVKEHVLRPMVRQSHNVFGRVAPWGLFGREPWAAYSAINPRWARSLQLARRIKASGHDPYFRPPADLHQARYDHLSLTDSAGAIWADLGDAYGLQACDPTMDKRLVEFCLSIPDEQYRLNGQDRTLIRRAMKGLLPEEVRLNTRRGSQAADLGRRFMAESAEVELTLARLESSALAREVLDLSRMKSVLHALEREVNVRTTAACGTILARGLMAGMFLLRFDDHAR